MDCDVCAINETELNGSEYDEVCDEFDGLYLDEMRCHHHHIVSSNYLLPSLCACLSCIVERLKVVQGARVCEE